MTDLKDCFMALTNSLLTINSRMANLWSVNSRVAKLLSHRMVRFAGVGAFGTVLNLGIMAVLLGFGAHYLVAAIVATELTILTNFLMQERLVFSDAAGNRPFWQRILVSFSFNNLETLARIPVLMLLVEVVLVPGVLAQAITLAVAFLARFTFTSRVIYKVRPAKNASSATPLVTVPPALVDPLEPVGVKIA